MEIRGRYWLLDRISNQKLCIITVSHNMIIIMYRHPRLISNAQFGMNRRIIVPAQYRSVMNIGPYLPLPPTKKSSWKYSPISFWHGYVVGISSSKEWKSRSDACHKRTDLRQSRTCHVMLLLGGFVIVNSHHPPDTSDGGMQQQQQQ